MGNNIVLYGSLGLLALAFGLQVMKRRLAPAKGAVFERMMSMALKAVFFAGALFILGWYVYLVWAQYLAWKGAGPPVSFLVPPYQSILYVAGYYFTRFGMYYAFSLAAALFFLVGGALYNRAFGGRFFEPEEPHLAALALVLLGNPAWNYLWIYYFGAVFAAALVALVIADATRNEDIRLPLYYVWMPLAIAGILLVQLL